jgi:hypothetical protein
MGTKLNTILSNVHRCVQPHKTHYFSADCCMATGFDPKCRSIIRSLYKNMNAYMNTVHSWALRQRGYFIHRKCRQLAASSDSSDSWQHHRIVQTCQVSEISAPWRWRQNVFRNCGVSEISDPASSSRGFCSKAKGTAVPLQAWTGPKGSRRLRVPDNQDNRHMKMVRLSAPHTGRLYTPGIIPGAHIC